MNLITDTEDESCTVLSSDSLDSRTVLQEKSASFDDVARTLSANQVAHLTGSCPGKCRLLAGWSLLSDVDTGSGGRSFSTVDTDTVDTSNPEDVVFRKASRGGAENGGICGENANVANVGGNGLGGEEGVGGEIISFGDLFWQT